MILFFASCKGPAEDGKLSFTTRDSDRTAVLSVLLDSTGMEYEINGNTFYYQVNDWEIFSEAEKDSFYVKKTILKNVNDKSYFSSLLDARNIRFLQVNQEDVYLFLWWPIDSNQYESILLDLVSNTSTK